MSTLREISEGYRQAAVLVRVQLDEIKGALETAPEADKPALRQRERELRCMIRELRDLRDVTANYYTRGRSQQYTSAGIRAGRRNSLR